MKVFAKLGSVVDFVRPAGVNGQPHVPLLALMPRQSADGGARSAAGPRR